MTFLNNFAKNLRKKFTEPKQILRQFSNNCAGCKNKQSIRKWAKETRKKLNISAISKKLVKILQETEEYKQAKTIMVYYPLQNEVDLRELFYDKNKVFCLPKIHGQELLCCPYCTDDRLNESCFKTKEPLTEPVSKSNIDLVLVPALACDKNNYRLGYGGGFYDRFLADIKADKICCIPKELIVETVFPEKYDIKMDKIITA